MGPFPTVITQLKFLVVDVDYFTKWVEVEVLATSWRKMYEALSRETLSTSTKSLESWPWTMKSSLTTNHSGIFAHNWELGIITPRRPTLRPMGRLRLQTDPCLKSLRLGSRRQRVYGQASCQVYYGHIGRQ